MDIQLATTNDAEDIAKMSRDYIEAGLGWSWNEARVIDAIRASETIVVVSKKGYVLSGFSIMHFKESAAHLCLLAVKPKYRRMGIGKALITWLEESAKTAGTFHLSLEVRKNNNTAQQFYKDLGYQQEQIIEGYYQQKEAAVKMSKDINVI
ncbi:MAG: GNAT family N-acetyltransferase [Algicola sp.]|nr:GNAT family N-acetyltransferase [Algicola sp.]